MPIYVHKCNNGHQFDVFKKLKDYNEPDTCKCGAPSRRIITATMIAPDMQDRYISPVSGKVISSYKQRREDMERHGCVDYEPSLKEHTTKHMEREEAALEKRMDNTVEKLIHEMPADKKASLERELKSGADIEYSRH